MLWMSVLKSSCICSIVCSCNAGNLLKVMTAAGMDYQHPVANALQEQLLGWAWLRDEGAKGSTGAFLPSNLLPGS